MQNLKYLILQLVFLNTIFSACSKENTRLSYAAEYIELVKANNYSAEELPEFSSEAISLLLSNANDFTEISRFPANPTVSQGPLRVTVCALLLWTVEHIRLNHGNFSENKYPSLMPELMEVNKGTKTLDNVQLVVVLNLYKDWWNSNKHMDFDNSRKIDPLSESDFKWK